MSDSRRARSSDGSSMSLNASWWWLVENGMSLAYWFDILINGDLVTSRNKTIWNVRLVGMFNFSMSRVVSEFEVRRGVY